MRRFYFFLLTLTISGCVKKSQDGVEFTGFARGIKNGVVIIATDRDSTVYGVNIINGKFSFHRQFDTPDYFRLKFSIDGKSAPIRPFTIYLEDGKYTLKTDTGSINKYPGISSTSKIQKELSAYYALADNAESEEQARIREFYEELRKKSDRLSAEAFNQLLTKKSAENAKIPHYTVAAFKQFAKQEPRNDIGIRLMDDLHYGSDPVNFYAIFKMLKPALRNSERGKYIGTQLSHMVKLFPGETAPEIYGKTPDGKTFDRKTINKQFIIVDFWRAGGELSSSNHQKLLKYVSNPGFVKRVTMVSVSLDTDAAAWKKAIKDDHLDWTQLSDLKGNNSPNVLNWMIEKYPTYYLLDSKWRILKKDMELNIPDE